MGKGKWVSEKKEGLLRLVGRILRVWGEKGQREVGRVEVVKRGWA